MNKEQVIDLLEKELESKKGWEDNRGFTADDLTNVDFDFSRKVFLLEFNFDEKLYVALDELTKGETEELLNYLKR